MSVHYKQVMVGGRTVNEHRHLMELHLGRKLGRDAVILHVYTTRASTPKAPRWRARIQLESVRIWTYPRTRPEAAATKAIAMVRAALDAGEVGDFVGLADGSFRRMRVGEMVIDDE